MKAFISSLVLHLLILSGGFFTFSFATSAFNLPESSNPFGVHAIEIGLLNLSTHNEVKAGSKKITTTDSNLVANNISEKNTQNAQSSQISQDTKANAQIKNMPTNKDVASLEEKNEVEISKKPTKAKEKNPSEKKIINHSVANTPKKVPVKNLLEDATSIEKNLQKNNTIEKNILEANPLNLPSTNEVAMLNSVQGNNGLGVQNIGKAGQTSGNNLFIDSGSLGYTGRIVKFTPPKYPERSRRAEEEGYIEVEVFTDNTGDITQISLLKSSGFDSLDKAALKSVKRAKFTAEAGRLVIPIIFELENLK